MSDMAQVPVERIPVAFETKQNSVERTADASRTVPLVLFGACSLAYFFCCIVISSRTGLWMDEVMASWMAKLPLKTIWVAISHGAMSSPPTYFYLLKGVTALFGSSYLSLRVISILSVYFTGVIAFLLMCKRFSLPVSLLAMAVCLETGLFGMGSGPEAYATEVREYGLVTLCFALAAFVWDQPDGQNLRTWRVALIALLLASAVALHFYAVLLVPAFGLMELLWSLKARRIRYSVWAGLFVAGASVFLWFPLMRQIMKYTGKYAASADYYAKPTVFHLLSTYADLAFGVKGITLLCCAICIVAFLLYWAKFNGTSSSLVNGDDERSEQGFVAAKNANLEIIILGSLAVPSIVYIFAIAVTHTYNARYGIVACFGFALLLARFVSFLRYRSLISYILVVASVLLLINAPRRVLAKNEDVYATKYLATTGDAPIVVGEGLAFFELQARADPKLLRRLIYLTMPAGETSPDISNEDLLKRWREFRLLNIQNPEIFMNANPHFYVLHTSESTDVITPWLMRQGFLRAKWNNSNQRDTRDVWLFEVQRDPKAQLPHE